MSGQGAALGRADVAEDIHSRSPSLTHASSGRGLPGGLRCAVSADAGGGRSDPQVSGRYRSDTSSITRVGSGVKALALATATAGGTDGLDSDVGELASLGTGLLP
jgi:hypothetical protein